jgi:hypothetical protein
MWVEQSLKLGPVFVRVGFGFAGIDMGGVISTGIRALEGRIGFGFAGKKHGPAWSVIFS